MAHRDDSEAEESDLHKKLKSLSKDLGVRQTNLRGFLKDELCALWHIESTDPPAVVRAKVTAQLERLIAGLSDEEQKLILRVSYNIGGIPGIESLGLTARRKVLAGRKESPHPSPRTSDRRFSEAVREFEDSLRNDPPQPVPQEELEEILGSRLTSPSVRVSDLPSPRHRSSLLAPLPILLIVAIIGAAVAGVWIFSRPDTGTSEEPGSHSTTPATSLSRTPIPPGATHAEVEAHRNGGVATWSDPRQPEQNGKSIAFMETVQVSCKVYSPVFGTVKWWYRIASSPWDNAWWAPANTFLNGDPLEGPYPHYEYDPAVPDC